MLLFLIYIKFNVLLDQSMIDKSIKNIENQVTINKDIKNQNLETKNEKQSGMSLCIKQIYK